MFILRLSQLRKHTTGKQQFPRLFPNFPDFYLTNLKFPDWVATLTLSFPYFKCFYLVSVQVWLCKQCAPRKKFATHSNGKNNKQYYKSNQ